MFKEHDEVTVVSDDQWDGAVGVVEEVVPTNKEARVLLNDEDTPLWFFFSELRKVGA